MKKIQIIGAVAAACAAAALFGAVNVAGAGQETPKISDATWVPAPDPAGPPDATFIPFPGR
jgi:hypothetical protein